MTSFCVQRGEGVKKGRKIAVILKVCPLTTTYSSNWTLFMVLTTNMILFCFYTFKIQYGYFLHVWDPHLWLEIFILLLGNNKILQLINQEGRGGGIFTFESVARVLFLWSSRREVYGVTAAKDLSHISPTSMQSTLLFAKWEKNSYIYILHENTWIEEIPDYFCIRECLLYWYRKCTVIGIKCWEIYREPCIAISFCKVISGSHLLASCRSWV